MTDEPKVGQEFEWRGIRFEVMSVEWTNRVRGEGNFEWYITARRWIKSKQKWSANAGTFRWAGIKGGYESR